MPTCQRSFLRRTAWNSCEFFYHHFHLLESFSLLLLVQMQRGYDSPSVTASSCQESTGCSFQLSCGFDCCCRPSFRSSRQPNRRKDESWPRSNKTCVRFSEFVSLVFLFSLKTVLSTSHLFLIFSSLQPTSLVSVFRSMPPRLLQILVPRRFADPAFICRKPSDFPLFLRTVVSRHRSTLPSIVPI